MVAFRTTKYNKTNILPLRWFANACENMASPLLLKAVYLMEDGLDDSLRYRIYSYMSSKLYKPYYKWGTYYTVNNLQEVTDWFNNPDNDEIMKRLGSDYDEDGIPYWEKTGTVDPDYEG